MTHAEAVKAIFRQNLGVTPPERVLVFTDKPTKREGALDPADAVRRESLRHMARLVEEAGRGFAGEVVFVEYPSTGGHGKEPPARLWPLAFGARAVDAMKDAGVFEPLIRKRASDVQRELAASLASRYADDAVDAVVALSNFSTSHTAFRSILTGSCGTRYASMPLFDAQMLAGPMTVDYRAMARTSKAVAALLTHAVGVRVTTEEGTDLSFSVKGRKAEADTGLLTRAGAFGNLPAGEAYLAPVEGTADGRMVLRYAPTRELASPVTLRVSAGRVVEVLGDEPFAGVLRGKIGQRADNANIAELGVGTNPRATRPDNVLESEKILGTIHIALGDNASFGGTVKTPFHQDFVFFRPTVTLAMRDGSEHVLLDRGALKPGGTEG
jgi:leucyl aminopeptidase (aminopeptidase T)